MASPLVAGVAALIAAANPSLTMLQVRSILLSAARPLASLQGFVITGSLVDAKAAVELARATAPQSRIAGYVRNRSRGVIDATVTIESRDGGGISRSATTGSDGSYSFSQLPLGSYVLRARKSRLRFSSVSLKCTHYSPSLRRSLRINSARGQAVVCRGSSQFCAGTFQNLLVLPGSQWRPAPLPPQHSIHHLRR